MAPASRKNKKTSPGEALPGESQAKVKRGQTGSGIRKKGRSSKSKTELEEPIVIAKTSKNPITIRKPSTIASRNSRRVRLSLDSIVNCEWNNGDITRHESSFGPDSVVNFTWGQAIDEPVLAIERKRRHCGLAAFNFRKGRQLSFQNFMYGERQCTKPAMDKTDVFPFLQLPLDIRQEVYGYLVINMRPIQLRPDCSVLEKSALNSHAILRVCKQVLQESLEVLYKGNIFVLGLAPPDDSRTCMKYLPNFHNVIVDCKIPTWNSMLDGSSISKTEACLAVLASSSGVLNSVTLSIDLELCAIVMLGGEQVLSGETLFSGPTTSIFAAGSYSMDCITKLKCTVLNVALKFAGVDPTIISINMWPLWADKHRHGGQDLFVNDVVWEIQKRERCIQVQRALRVLGIRVERIWQDWLKAALVANGQSKLLEQLMPYYSAKIETAHETKT